MAFLPFRCPPVAVLTFLDSPPAVGQPHRQLFTARPPVPQSVRVPGISRDIQVKRASEPDEWEQAYQMVAANYKARGYEAPSPKQVRFTPYHALPDTVTFVAKYQGRVVATLSMVLDNSLLGLPIEAVYPDEIAELRLQGRR